MLWYQLRLWWETPKSEDTRGEAQGRNLLFAQLRLGAFWEVSRAFRDKLGDKVGGVNTWGKHLQRPGSCHCVSLTLVLWSSSYLWNLFNWFEFTKEWLIQNCLWQKYTLLWLYSSGSNIVMGLLGAEHWLSFSLMTMIPMLRVEFRLRPFVLLTLHPLRC